MRNAEEIVAWLKSVKDDFLGFSHEVALSYLTFEQAKPFLKPEATADKWPTPRPLTREAVLEDMKNYMDFAWGKVEDHRGISAGRSVQKMEAWVALLGDDWLVVTKNADYPNYGAPILKALCEHYQFPMPESEALKNMAAGEPCYIGCEEGCGQ